MIATSVPNPFSTSASLTSCRALCISVASQQSPIAHLTVIVLLVLLKPNRSLDRYSAACSRKGNFLPSFIFLLASCFLCCHIGSCLRSCVRLCHSLACARMYARYPEIFVFLLSHLSHVPQQSRNDSMKVNPY